MTTRTCTCVAGQRSITVGRDPLRGEIRAVLQRRASAVAVGSVLSAAPLTLASPFPPVIELSSLLPVNGGRGIAGFVLQGTDSGDFAGWSVSAGGDINGDGIDDLIIGAFGADDLAGVT